MFGFRTVLSFGKFCFYSTLSQTQNFCTGCTVHIQQSLPPSVASCLTYTVFENQDNFCKKYMTFDIITYCSSVQGDGSKMNNNFGCKKILICSNTNSFSDSVLTIPFSCVSLSHPTVPTVLYIVFIQIGKRVKGLGVRFLNYSANS